MDSGQKIVGLREQWAGIGLIIGEWNGLNNHLASAGTRAHFLSRFDHHMDQDDQWQWENQELPCVSHFLGLFQSPYVHMFLLLPAFHLLTLFFFPPPHLASHPPVLCSPKFSILHFATNFFSLNSLLPFFNDYYIILGQKINPFKKKFTHKKNVKEIERIPKQQQKWYQLEEDDIHERLERFGVPTLEEEIQRGELMAK